MRAPLLLQPAAGVVRGLRIAACIWVSGAIIGYGLTAALVAGHEESQRILLAGQEHFKAEPRTANGGVR